ncbi:MAG TPA: DUF5667 domain-containing protein [Marmoricola sp.]|nr:DUF5667 domain-containing protein [Marmoricola sp.]
MTSLIAARRAAEEFARVLDGSQTDVADRYADLTATVDLLRHQDPPSARPEFVADLRAQLMTAADTLLVPTDSEPAPVVPLRPARPHRRRLAAAAAAIVVVGGTAGVAAAAENALPGDPLYPIKRGIESAQVSLNTSDAARGRDLVDQASSRLDEIHGLVGSGDNSSRIADTLASFKRSEANGADLLFVAYQRGGSADDLAALRTTLSSQSKRLDALAGQAPAELRPDFADARAFLGDLDQQARVLCANCGPDNGTGDFTGLSSSPAMQTLITQSASAAVAEQRRSEAQALAAKAAEIAAKTPMPATPSTTQVATTGSGSVLPGVPIQVPATPTQDTTLKGTVTTVTGGVQGLLTTVDSTTGGLLTPVTTTVNNTLDAVTNILVGP